jgi:hypothetical protein
LKKATVFQPFLQNFSHRASKCAVRFFRYIKVIKSCDASTIKINAMG